MSYTPLPQERVDVPPSYDFAVSQPAAGAPTAPNVVHVHHHSSPEPPTHVAGGTLLAIILLIKAVAWLSLSIYVFVNGSALLNLLGPSSSRAVHMLHGRSATPMTLWYRMFAGLLTISVLEVTSATITIVHGCALGCCSRLPIAMHKLSLVCWVINLLLELPLLLVTAAIALIFMALSVGVNLAEASFGIYLMFYGPFVVSLVAFIWTCVIVHKSRMNLRAARRLENEGHLMGTVV